MTTQQLEQPKIDPAIPQAPSTEQQSGDAESDTFSGVHPAIPQPPKSQTDTDEDVPGGRDVSSTNES